MADNDVEDAEKQHSDSRYSDDAGLHVAMSLENEVTYARRRRPIRRPLDYERITHMTISLAAVATTLIRLIIVIPVCLEVSNGPHGKGSDVCKYFRSRTVLQQHIIIAVVVTAFIIVTSINFTVTSHHKMISMSHYDS